MTDICFGMKLSRRELRIVGQSLFTFLERFISFIIEVLKLVVKLPKNFIVDVYDGINRFFFSENLEEVAYIFIGGYFRNVFRSYL